MRYPQGLALACLLCLPATTRAVEPGYLDLFYTPKAKVEHSSELGSTNDAGSGFGLKGWVPLDSGIAFTGEYQTATYDEFDTEVDQVRFGLGLHGDTRSGIYIEYLDADLEGEKTDGFAGQLRIEGASSDSKLYGQVGYLKLSNTSEDLKGLEWLIGMGLPINEKTGGFVDFRKTRLKGETSGAESVFTDVRLGVRINF